MNFSVTKNGQSLNPNLYTWDEQTRTFSTNENNLVLDFSGIHGVTFNTGSFCTFNTGPNCTFDTGPSCTFDTGSYCTFDTGSSCIFKTGSYCTFKTGSYCTFDTGWNCTFNTGSYCTFNTGSYCTFKTGPNCVVIRRDIFEVIKLEKEENHIKLNGYSVSGYEEIKTEHTN